MKKLKRYLQILNTILKKITSNISRYLNFNDYVELFDG